MPKPLPVLWSAEGWNADDWETVELLSLELRNVAAELAAQVRPGAIHCAPQALGDLQRQLQVIARRLGQCTEGYL
jgi:hypothetical protein